MSQFLKKCARELRAQLLLRTCSDVPNFWNGISPYTENSPHFIMYLLAGKIRFCLPIKNFGQIFLLYFLVCLFSCELSMLAQASRMGYAPLTDTFLFLKYFKKIKMKSP
jgi:hypothetical protein